ncbi:MAG: L,D-transpeptidase [Muribaculaceae bacterium]|nr:L,D-transpeptidase [Muribaculaceae bacterium]
MTHASPRAPRTGRDRRHNESPSATGALTICLVLALLFCMAACAPRFRTGEEMGDDAVEDTLTVAADTVEVPAGPVWKSFSGTEEILAYMEASPSASRYRVGILPDMAREAPDYAEKLLNNHYPRFLIADKGSMRVIVYDSLGVELRSFRMAAGKNYGTKHKRRDCRTPEGFFSVEGVYNSTEWLYTDDDGNTSQVKGQFGPRFIRLLIPTTRQIGIHGTCAPWSVGGRRSHGCMRLKNEDILELVNLVDSGMPVIVNPSWRDMQVNESEGADVRRVRTGYADITRPKTAAAPAADSATVSSDTSAVAPKHESIHTPEVSPADSVSEPGI